MNDKNNEDTIVNSVVGSQDACRTLTTQYYSAIQAFVKSLSSNPHDTLRARFVPFSVFIARLYRKLAGTPEMRRDYYTTMSYTEKDKLLGDVVRQVMNSSVDWGEASRVARSPGTVSPQGSSTTSFTKPIQPSDSVSNISKLSNKDIIMLSTSTTSENTGSVFSLGFGM